MAELGSYAFLPWLRRGIATEIARIEGDAPPVGQVARVDVSVAVTLNETLTRSVPLALLGPGDITGVDRDVIIRLSPPNGVFDVETNYFPHIEFDQADFPWRYTAASAATTDRLTPWMVLVVLRDDEIDSLLEAGHTGGLAVLSIADADLLPPWDQAWAWAHAQISGVKSVTPAEASDILRTSPARAISRLLSPRRLEPNTAYTVFLVPAYERGRLAGLGDPVPDALDAMAPAWGTHGAVRLPVYYRWRFGTGASGDFEFLVQQLVARILPPTIGRRDMSVATPGANLPPAFAAALGLEGALHAIGMQRTDWTGATQSTFVAALAQLLNLPARRLDAEGEDRVVVPPLYGRWHAKANELAPGAQPFWFNNLNQDPRERVAAGAGTEVIRQQQRQLMASAWQQVDGVREANERLRRTQLARELALRIYERHLARGDADALLMLTAPVHARIMASPVTIHARLVASPVLPGLLAPQFRRITRPRGPVGRRQGRPLTPGPSRVVSRVNDGALTRPTEPKTSPAITTPQSAPPTAPPTNAEELRARARLLSLLAIVLFVVALVIGFAVGGAFGWTAALLAAGAGVVAFTRAAPLRRDADRAESQAAFAGSVFSVAAIAEAPARSDFAPVERTPGVLSSSFVPAAHAAGGSDNVAARAFRQAAEQLMTRMVDVPETPAPLPRVSMETLRTKVSAALQPRLTVVAGVHDRLRLPENVRQPTTDPVEPVMAAPVFAQPMYEPLAALSQDFMLPGLEQVPPNTVTTVLTNQRFIEAYMTGLNHEMARELQWNEYPTDMRGTYFRQFWDPAGTAADPSTTLDITPLHTWTPDSELGAHPVRVPPPGGEQLVLLVRGELFRRYPNTQVYAVKAKMGAQGHELTDVEVLPIFSGRIQPDVAFFGFTLTATDARGDEDPQSPNQGWFFVLQEHPTEPRFGMDASVAAGGRPTAWSNLSWGHLAATDAELSQIDYIDLAAALPDTSVVNPTGGAHWHVGEGARASDLAFITLQQPMRVAVHGGKMIPAP